MRRALPEAVAASLDDDEFINILDMIFDWEEENGLDDIDPDDDDIDNDRTALVAALTAHVTKMLARDKGASFPVEYVTAAIEAELDYEDEIAAL